MRDGHWDLRTIEGKIINRIYHSIEWFPSFVQHLPRFDHDDIDSTPKLSDEVRDIYNEWRRHVTSLLDNEPDVYRFEEEETNERKKS